MKENFYVFLIYMTSLQILFRQSLIKTLRVYMHTHIYKETQLKLCFMFSLSLYFDKNNNNKKSFLLFPTVHRSHNKLHCTAL